MKWTHPELERVFDTESDAVPTLIVENRPFFVRLLSDLYQQTDGFSGQSVLSRNDTPIDFTKNAEIIENFVPFDINRKTLITKMISALEKAASSPEQTVPTGDLLQRIEEYLGGIAFDFPCDIIFPKLSISGLIKSAGPELRAEYETISEAVLDYMELVQTFDRERLFITVNMRCFVADEEMALFLSTAHSHGYHLLMLESHAYPLLPMESRTVVDDDLCEF